MASTPGASWSAPNTLKSPPFLAHTCSPRRVTGWPWPIRSRAAFPSSTTGSWNSAAGCPRSSSSPRCGTNTSCESLLAAFCRRRSPGRPKKPYRAPIHRSFFNPRATAYVRELLSEKALREAGLFHPGAVAKLVTKIDQAQVLGETDDMALAGIVSSQLFYGQFLKNFQRARPLSACDDVKVCDRRKPPLHNSPRPYAPSHARF